MMWTEFFKGLVLYLVGFGSGLVALSSWQRIRGDEPVPTQRVVAVAIFAVVVGASVIGVFNAHQMREQAACQSEVNRQFLEALSSNVDLNRANRTALDTAIERLAEDEHDQGREILGDYLQERERIEAERETYPPLPEEVCG